MTVRGQTALRCTILWPDQIWILYFLLGELVLSQIKSKIGQRERTEEDGEKRR